MTLSTLDLVIFVGFIIAVLTVGMIKSGGAKEGESTADYFLAGRGLPWWLIGISLIAANISTEQFVGMSGSAADYLGLAIASYEWMAAVTLVVVAFVFLPKFLRAGIYTMPEFLEVRYNAAARAIMAFVTMIVLVGVSLAAVIYSGGLTMSELFHGQAILGVPVTLETSVWAIGLMAAAYVAFGGLKACAWADLLQGIALVLGGGVIAWFGLRALGAAPLADLATFGTPTAALSESSSGLQRLFALNHDKLHMVLPKSDLNIPWTALVVGLWIPNFYYWGLNQYITQRTLGSASLAEGQRGIVFAAALKLIIPFVIVFPGLMAFNLFSGDMAQSAARDPGIAKANEAVLARFEQVRGHADSATVFAYDQGWAQLNPSLAPAIDAHNAAVRAAAPAQLKEEKLVGYKFDTALSLLISRLLPENSGLRGFVLAALLGAVVSSLAAMLNAASTIFTMDIFHKHVARRASQKTLVAVGRISVGVFVVIGCLEAPLLGNPAFGGIFKFIQEFQGYVSPGILAVFVYGLLSKRAPASAGIAGLLLNPVLYFLLATFAPGVAFLDRMAICFAAVLVAMFAITKVRPRETDFVFTSSGAVAVDTSKGARLCGIGVVVATLVLYAIFW